MKNNKGFTLIELLVTIAIISLLSSIVFASMSSAREKANITKAKVQSKEIEKAVELSRLSNGSIPFSNTNSTLSIKEEEVAGELMEYYPAINSVELPSGGTFNGGDYYILTEDGEARVNDPYLDRDFLLKCAPYNNSALSDDEYDLVNFRNNVTSSWVADDFVIAYKMYGDFQHPNYCPTEPEGVENVLYYYDDTDVDPYYHFWRIYDMSCNKVWVCGK